MDDFERLWRESQPPAAAKEEEPTEDTPEYMIRDGLARLSIWADMILEYMYAKHGQPIYDTEPDSVDFTLK